MANVFSSIRMQLASWFSRQRTANVPIPGYGNYAPTQSIGTKEVYPEINTQKAIQYGFEGNAAVYSITMKDATKFGSITYYLYSKQKSEQKALSADKIEHEALERLLQQPNPEMSQDLFFTLIRCYYKICGEAFIWLNRGDTSDIATGQEIDDSLHAKKPVLEMYVLPADQIVVVPDPENQWGVYGYILESNYRIPLRKVDVIHWKMPNLRFDAVSKTHLRGMSPLHPGEVIIELGASTEKSMLRGVQNDGSKGAMFNKELSKMTAEQESKLRAVIDRKANHLDTKNAVATIQGDWGWIDFGRTAVEMELIKGREFSWKEICFLLDVPYVFFDPDAPYNTQEYQNKNWILNSIIPAGKQFAGELNRKLLPAFGLQQKAFIGLDPNDFPELRKDLGTLATALNTAYWLTPNEKRIEFGYEERPEPEMDEVWVPQGISTITERQDSARMEQEAINYERTVEQSRDQSESI